MHTLIITLLSILGLYFIFVLSTILTLYPNYKNYKVTYDALIKGSVLFSYTYGGLYYFSSNIEELSFMDGGEIIFFEDEKDIKLLG